MERLLAPAGRIGADPRDHPDLRLRKLMLVTFVVTFWPLPLLWSLLYLAYGERIAAAIPFGYDVVALASLALFAATRRFGPFRAINIALFVCLPFLLQLALGGFAPSSAVVMWSVVAPFAALVLAGVRAAAWWLAAFGVELAAAARDRARALGDTPPQCAPA